MTVFEIFPAVILQASQSVHMTAGGWVFLIVAWIFILTLTFYTFGKILGKK